MKDILSILSEKSSIIRSFCGDTEVSKWFGSVGGYRRIVGSSKQIECGLQPCLGGTTLLCGEIAKWFGSVDESAPTRSNVIGKKNLECVRRSVEPLSLNSIQDPLLICNQQWVQPLNFQYNYDIPINIISTYAVRSSISRSPESVCSGERIFLFFPCRFVSGGVFL